MNTFKKAIAIAFLATGFYACADEAKQASAAEEVKNMETPVAMTDALPTKLDQVEATLQADPASVIPASKQNMVKKEEMQPTTAREVKEEMPSSMPAKEAAASKAPPTKTSPPPPPPATAKKTATPPPPPPPVPVAQDPAPAAAPTEAMEPPTVVEEMPISEVYPDHGPWDALLQKHVNGSGKVNYAGIKANEAALDAYLASLAKEIPDGQWDRKEAMAYWINAYNAYTVKLIVDNYPLKSITDLDGGDPWKVKWINLAGKKYSLNNIEHDILRPRYKDARIHFAVVCAAESCPPLPNRAFTASNLNRMMEQKARAFIRNPKFNQTTGEVKVSKIFDWYGEDFGDLRTYLNKYATTPIPAGTDIGYMDYDWSLNKQ